MKKKTGKGKAGGQSAIKIKLESLKKNLCKNKRTGDGDSFGGKTAKKSKTKND